MKKGRTKSSFNVIGIFAQKKRGGSGGRDWLKADCLFAQGELLGTLSWQPWRSHIVPICPVSDLRIYSLPNFVPIIISLHFVFHTIEVIMEHTYWKCLNVIRIDEWGDAASLPLYQHQKIRPGGSCLRKCQTSYRRMGKGWQMEIIPQAIVWGGILFQKEEMWYILSHLFNLTENSLWFRAVYGLLGSSGYLQGMIWGRSKIPVQMISAGFHNTYRRAWGDSYSDVRH